MKVDVAGIFGTVTPGEGCEMGYWFAGDVIDLACMPGRGETALLGVVATGDRCSMVGSEGPGPSTSSMESKVF